MAGNCMLFLLLLVLYSDISHFINSQVGNDDNSELEDAHLPPLGVGSGSAASPQNHDKHVVGLEESTETGTWGRLG